MTDRVPTENQYRLLLVLGSGAQLVIATSREAKAAIRHGWMDGNRITPAGPRALAAAVERYGLPGMKATPA